MIKLTKKEKQIINFMKDGFPMIIGVSETTGKNYYMVASTHNKGFDSTYFRSDVFTNLLSKGIIYQQSSHPFDYILTRFAETLKT